MNELTTIKEIDFTHIAVVENIIAMYNPKAQESPLRQAVVMAKAIEGLQNALTPEIMEPITMLKGKALGFKTDKDRKGTPYTAAEIKDCFIHSLMLGLQPIDNAWNIICGQCYVTKNGCLYLLNKVPGLHYSIIPGIPKSQPGGALVKVMVKWHYSGGREKSEQLEFACKGDSSTGADAYIGKATRKAAAWLLNSHSSIKVDEGDVEDSIDVVSEEVGNGNKLKVASIETRESASATVQMEFPVVEDEVHTDEEGNVL